MSKRRVQSASGRKFTVAGTMVLCFVMMGAQSLSAQSLGEIARRERKKNKQLPNPAAHVYTNDDMKRPEILLPQDRTRFEADRKPPAPAAAPESAAAPPEVGKPTTIPLGDVARYSRELRQLQEQQQRIREKALPGGEVSASPKLTAPELIPSLRSRRALPQPFSRRDPFSRSRSQSPAGRHDPFSRTRREPPVPPETPQAAEGIRVRHGDSLWKLAAKYLGDGTKWQEILAVNPDLTDPNLIRVGDEIRLPEQARSRAVRQQRVRCGDSLWKLAQAHLGGGSRWTCIAQANPEIQDANRIYPGQTLSIPASCGSASEASATARAST